MANCDRDISFNMPGFYSLYLYRNQYGGGLKLYIKNCFKAEVLNNFTVLNDLPYLKFWKF